MHKEEYSVRIGHFILEIIVDIMSHFSLDLVDHEAMLLVDPNSEQTNGDPNSEW